MSEFRRKNREHVEEKLERKKLDRNQAALVQKDLNADKRQAAPGSANTDTYVVIFAPVALDRAARLWYTARKFIGRAHKQA